MEKSNKMNPAGELGAPATAGVGGVDGNVSSNVAGPHRSTSCDREGTGVASQAPATLRATRAEGRTLIRGSSGRSNSNSASAKSTSTGVGKTAPAGRKSVTSLQSLEQNESGILRQMRKELNTLNELGKKVRTEGVKEAIGKVHGLFNLLTVNKNEQRLAKVDIDHHEPQNSLNESVDALREELRNSNKRILTALASVGPKLTSSRDKNIGAAEITCDDQIGAELAPECKRPGPLTWTEVINKGPGRKVAGTIQNPASAVSGPSRMPSRQPPRNQQAHAKAAKVLRARPPAILVDVGRDAFPELAKKIREEVNKDLIGSDVVGIRQTKSGGLLIEVRGDDAKVESVRVEIERAAGEKVGVKTLRKRNAIEVRDLDEWTTKDEIADTVRSIAGTDSNAISVVNLRKHFGGTQSALILTSPQSAAKILKERRILISLVSCQVRLKETKIRCFRCHSEGHKANVCSGIDRSNCCWRCGAKDHFAIDCKTTHVEENNDD